jgi:Flp pilus assembly protein TadD
LGRYDEAIQALDIAIEMKPNNPNAWTGKGIALRQLGRYDEASMCYDKAAELRSKV